MHDDLAMAEMLGQAPRTPDPAFRVEVFARIARRASRRAALRRGALQLAACTGLGLAALVAQAAGMNAEHIAPMLGAAAALAFAGLCAATLIEGPRAVLARSRAALRLA